MNRSTSGNGTTGLQDTRDINMGLQDLFASYDFED